MNDKYFLVLNTCPDQATADAIAKTLVTEGLAACVSRLPGLRSTYCWKGRMLDDAEVLLFVKTSGARLATLTARIGELHPYEVPEIIALEIVAGSERYLDWLGQTLAAAGQRPDPSATQDS